MELFNRHKCEYELFLHKHDVTTKPKFDREKGVLFVLHGDIYVEKCVECGRMKSGSYQWDAERLEFEPTNLEELVLDG